MADTFTQYFYDLCAAPLFGPLSELPELKDLNGKLLVLVCLLTILGSMPLTVERVPLINTLVDLLSYCVAVHAHRAQYYILSNPLAQKVCSLIYAREKPLRHASLRFIKACLRTNNHFIHRNFAKNGVTKAILDLVLRETDRDTMLSSACLDTLELIRKENMKPIIVDMFEKYEPVMTRLAERPFVRSYVLGLRIRWDQYKEPPPPPPPQTAESSKARTVAEEEDAWFQQSDDEDANGGDTSTSDSSSESQVPAKRKRVFQATGPSPKRPSPSKPTPALGLDYDDASDSEGSTDGESPKATGRRPSPSIDSTETEHLAEELTDVEQKVRAKRMRNEEEEEEAGGFADLVKGVKKGGAGSASGGPQASARTVKEEKESTAEGAASGGSGGGKEKKIRLSLSGLSKKFGGSKAQ